MYNKFHVCKKFCDLIHDYNPKPIPARVSVLFQAIYNFAFSFRFICRGLACVLRFFFFQSGTSRLWSIQQGIGILTYPVSTMIYRYRTNSVHKVYLATSLLSQTIILDAQMYQTMQSPMRQLIVIARTRNDLLMWAIWCMASRFAKRKKIVDMCWSRITLLRRCRCRCR